MTMTNPDLGRDEHASFDDAARKIRKILADGGWHRRMTEIEALAPRVADSMFGRVKADLNIKHQKIGAAGGYYEWRLCPDCSELPVSEKCPSVPYARAR